MSAAAVAASFAVSHHAESITNNLISEKDPREMQKILESIIPKMYPDYETKYNINEVDTTKGPTTGSITIQGNKTRKGFWNTPEFYIQIGFTQFPEITLYTFSDRPENIVLLAYFRHYLFSKES